MCSWWIGHLKNITTKSSLITWGWRRFVRHGYRNFRHHFNVPIESAVVKNFWKIAIKIQMDFLVVLWRGTRHGYTTTIHSTSKKQRLGRNQAKRHQPDHESHDRLARSSWPSPDSVKVLFLSIFYHFALQSIVHITHYSFTRLRSSIQ